MNSQGISEIWRTLLIKSGIETDAVVVEIAPGFKTKIAAALQALDFKGTIYLVEANPAAMSVVLKLYRDLLPKACIVPVKKAFHDIVVGIDLPQSIDYLVANHAFDDMVLFESAPKDEVANFFMLNSGPDRVQATARIWGNITDETIKKSITKVAKDWECFIARLNIKKIIVSQYKSNTLEKNKIYRPDYAGKTVLEKLSKTLDAEIYEPYKSYLERNGFADRWLIKTLKQKSLLLDITKKPEAFQRLHQSIFCKERARKLTKKEYGVVYTNNSLLKNLGYITGTERQNAINALIGRAFAYVLVSPKEKNKFDKTVYSDYQSDPTDIALSGNKGSGRACYIGSDFNIKGIGQTRLVKNPKDPIHGNGALDIVTALREAITTEYLERVLEHGSSPIIAVIMLKEKISVPWQRKPIHKALLIRYDNGTLDRPSHLVYKNLKRTVRLDNIVKNYARLDAEMFAHRILHGAWSSGNISLDGNLLDIESVGILSGRGPRCNITKKYLSNYFGYESLGFKQVIKQITDVTGERIGAYLKKYECERKEVMKEQLLRLLGVSETKMGMASDLSQIKKLTRDFESLAKKCSPRDVSLNIFGNKDPGTHLLDFSNLFKKLPEIFKQNSKKRQVACALQNLIRHDELAYSKRITNKTTTNKAEQYLNKHAIIFKKNLPKFLNQTTEFVENLIKFINLLQKNNIMPTQKLWKQNLAKANKEQPDFEVLTAKTKLSVNKYLNGAISNKKLNTIINNLISNF